MHRCEWATTDSAILYHDLEWGVPLHDDKSLLEFLVLEGAQAGLSWQTILNKRQRYIEVFDGFDPEKIARYGSDKIEALLSDPGIVKNRRKIESAVQNARVFLDIQQQFGSFDRYIWQYVNNQPIQNHHLNISQIPAKNELSEKISLDLRKRGMNFVGPTIIYAFMQAVGMVNDHIVSCFRYSQIQKGSNKEI
jgi:DNA-3-methyladenine glycosylase I